MTGISETGHSKAQYLLAALSQDLSPALDPKSVIKVDGRYRLVVTETTEIPVQGIRLGALRKRACGGRRSVASSTAASSIMCRRRSGAPCSLIIRNSPGIWGKGHAGEIDFQQFGLGFSIVRAVKFPVDVIEHATMLAAPRVGLRCATLQQRNLCGADGMRSQKGRRWMRFRIAARSLAAGRR